MGMGAMAHERARICCEESAPSQDGLSYAFGAGAPDFAHDMSDTIAETAQSGGAMPRALVKASVMVTIPKSEILGVNVAARCSARWPAHIPRRFQLVTLRAN